MERELDFHHLKVFIALGYRVNSEEASHFRKWATDTLDEFVTKGYIPFAILMIFKFFCHNHLLLMIVCKDKHCF